MQLTFDQPAGLSSHDVLTGPFTPPIEQEIEVMDSTLREGEQPPGVVFTPDEKFAIAEKLDDLGMHWISAGFPPVSKEEQATAKRLTSAGFKMRTAALCRVLPSDIDICAEVGVDAISLFLGGSDSHLNDKLRWTEAEAYDRITKAVQHVKSTGKLCWFGVEDGSRTPLPRLVRMFQTAVDAGCDLLILPDTLGVLVPTAAYRIVSILVSLFPGIPVVPHFHNDMGLALANTLAGFEAGARGCHVTINGVGERCGNTCLEELAVVLKVKYGVDLGFKLDRLYDLSMHVHQLSGTHPSEHKPIVGKWCFSHESGIHVAGVLANRESYQPYPPELIGRHHEILFGKHSGMAGVLHLARKHGLEVPEGARQDILARIKERAEQTKTNVAEEEIVEWIRAAG